MRFFAGPRLLIIDEVGYLPLPAEAAGKPVTVVDKTDSVTVGDTAVSASGTVTVSVAAGYGFAVLKVAGVAE